jgi:hypothetical protein
MKTAISIAASVILFFCASSARALTIDTTQLDQVHTESSGPFGVLNWSGVSLKLTTGYNGKTTAMIDAQTDVRVDSGSYLSLEAPEKAALSRIVKGKNGEVRYEHVDLSIATENPALQVTSRSSVRLREVARLDTHADRAMTIPIYAYRADAKHVVVLIEADGSLLGKRDAADNGTCAQNGGKCVIDAPDFQYHMVGILLGADRAIGQARGDVQFEQAPKGETNAPRTYIVNASFTQTARDPEPVVAITMHSIETVFQGDGDGE